MEMNTVFVESPLRQMYNMDMNDSNGEINKLSIIYIITIREDRDDEQHCLRINRTI